MQSPREWGPRDIYINDVRGRCCVSPPSPKTTPRQCIKTRHPLCRHINVGAQKFDGWMRVHKPSTLSGTKFEGSGSNTISNEAWDRQGRAVDRRRLHSATPVVMLQASLSRFVPSFETFKNRERHEQPWFSDASHCAPQKEWWHWMIWSTSLPSNRGSSSLRSIRVSDPSFA